MSHVAQPKKEFGLGPNNFEVSIQCLCRVVELANGYRNLVFREGIWLADINLEVISLVLLLLLLSRFSRVRLCATP